MHNNYLKHVFIDVSASLPSLALPHVPSSRATVPPSAQIRVRQRRRVRALTSSSTMAITGSPASLICLHNGPEGWPSIMQSDTVTLDLKTNRGNPAQKNMSYTGQRQTLSFDKGDGGVASQTRTPNTIIDSEGSYAWRRFNPRSTNLNGPYSLMNEPKARTPRSRFPTLHIRGGHEVL